MTHEWLSGIWSLLDMTNFPDSRHRTPLQVAMELEDDEGDWVDEED